MSPRRAVPSGILCTHAAPLGQYTHTVDASRQLCTVTVSGVWYTTRCMASWARQTCTGWMMHAVNYCKGVCQMKARKSCSLRSVAVQ